ncbi:MAG TPA: glycosyltransferase family 2 protein [Pirellulaceae bacterium]|nr:glycosyltransferase family 2 protein [Pirellulaceae bacterium]HMO92528.1 glycosyltransferase family 2 protein [Pirellulaceae bacterium]HMP68989.1 glycosyltransferase family 2 protein [Pirellulaceae bacterium]
MVTKSSNSLADPDELSMRHAAQADALDKISSLPEEGAQHVSQSPKLTECRASELDAYRPFSVGRIIFALPAYNEGESLPPLLTRIQTAMNGRGQNFHVVIANDGSKDDTELVASRFSFHMDLTLINHEVNQGFGAAMKSAVLGACEIADKHDVIVTMDADNTQPPESIYRMVDLINEGYDVIIASRYRPGARVVGVPWHRNIYSLGARLLFTCLFPTRGVRDYTSGFRAVRASVLHDAVRVYGDRLFTEDGFSATVDMLLKLRRLPRTTLFYEVPLVLRYDQKPGASKMNVTRTIIKTLKLMLKRKVQQ